MKFGELKTKEHHPSFLLVTLGGSPPENSIKRLPWRRRNYNELHGSFTSKAGGVGRVLSGIVIRGT
jgi:hypothetical protein